MVVKRRISSLFLSVFTILVVLSVTFEVHALGSGTSLAINPSIYVAHQDGEIFNSSINVNNVQNLANCELTITYDTSLLSVSKVLPGTFFPSAPNSRFTFDNKTSPGSIQINCSIINPIQSRNGSGTLAFITFTVAFNSGSPVESPLEFGSTLLVDSKSKTIAHDTLDAICFWKSISPDHPLDGRLLDLYTQKGGEGSAQPGGFFVIGEEIDLTANVTYNGFPVQNKLVAFEIQDPLNQTQILRTAVTDQNGLATISFKVPNAQESIGQWMGIAVVDIAEVATWDTITFFIGPTPVGGFSVSLDLTPKISPLQPYFLTIFALTLAYVVFERKRKYS
jgi:hypothetical protein